MLCHDAQDDPRQDIVDRYKITTIVLGLPLRMDGTEGTRAEKTRKFAAWLDKHLRVPVVCWDERLTTKPAIKIPS